MTDNFFGRCFRGFVLPVLDYCSAVWFSAADTHLKLLDRAVSCPKFLSGGVFECDMAHRRSVAVTDRMCQCWLHAASWSHIGILMLRLAAELRSAAGLLY